MEQCLSGNIEELKAFFLKKFIDHNELQKLFKYIDIKISGQSLKSPSVNTSNDWLLAKKPLNNYMCAACESYLGPLKQSTDFIQWNKLPTQKKYRMGHGFSRMLQMVNFDILKNAEKLNSDLKIDEKKINYDKFLPRISSQKDFSNTYSQLRGNKSDEVILNNSADNLEITKEIEIENNPNEKVVDEQILNIHGESLYGKDCIKNR
jgi:hypothetical protein